MAECPDGFVPVRINLPPYYVCVPVEKRSTEKKQECFTVYAPVIALVNPKAPAIYQTIAFAYDIYTTPTKIPLVDVKPNVKSDKLVEVTAPSFLKAFETLLLHNLKKTVGSASVRVSEIRNVFEPICETSYVLVRLVGGEIVKAVAISPSYEQLSTYLASALVSSPRLMSTKSTYTILQTAVQFFMTPEQVTAFITASTGR